jgi:hypothetical protein
MLIILVVLINMFMVYYIMQLRGFAESQRFTKLELFKKVFNVLVGDFDD